MKGKYTVWLLGIFFVIFIGYSPGYAQSETGEVVVKLKNGYAYKGILLESNQEELLLQIEGKKVSFSHAQIKKVSYKDTKVSKSGNKIFADDGTEIKPVETPGRFTIPGKGFFNINEIGLVTRQNNFGQPNHTPLIFQTINGYRLNSHLYGGVGLGFARFEDISTFPVFASFRADLFENRVTPFYHADIGYSIAWETEADGVDRYEKVRGGLMVHPGMGIKIRTGGPALHFAVGYLFQKTDLDFNVRSFAPGDNSVHQKRNFRRVSFKIGLSF